MTDREIDAAGKLRAKASKSLDAMRAHVARTDAARSDTVHQARAVQVVEAATTAADANRVAARSVDGPRHPRDQTGARLSARGRAGRPHRPPMGALGSVR